MTCSGDRVRSISFPVRFSTKISGGGGLHQCFYLMCSAVVASPGVNLSDEGINTPVLNGMLSPLVISTLPTQYKNNLNRAAVNLIITQCQWLGLWLDHMYPPNCNIWKGSFIHSVTYCPCYYPWITNLVFVLNFQDNAMLSFEGSQIQGNENIVAKFVVSNY